MSYPKYYYQDINKLASNLDFPCLDLTLMDLGQGLDLGLGIGLVNFRKVAIHLIYFKSTKNPTLPMSTFLGKLF